MERTEGGGGRRSHTAPFEQAVGRNLYSLLLPVCTPEWSRLSWGGEGGHARGLGRAQERREEQVGGWLVPRAGRRGLAWPGLAAAVAIALPRAGLAACGAARSDASLYAVAAGLGRPARAGEHGAALWRDVR